MVKTFTGQAFLVLRGEPMKHVLIVDDHPNILYLLTEVISEMGIKPVVARNGREAIFEMKKTPIDLIISDLDMPEMNGKELLKYVKKEKPDISFLIMTGRCEKEIEEEVSSLGADGYIPKPFRIDYMEQMLGSLLK
jgi:CheY-like chemotaxis protein